jgi:hypothetical protein
LEQEILRLQELTRTRHYVAALAAIEPLPARHSADRDPLYLAALNLRYLNRVPDALELLRHLEHHHPRYSRLHQVRGHCYRFCKITLVPHQKFFIVFESTSNTKTTLRSANTSRNGSRDIELMSFDGAAQAFSIVDVRRRGPVMPRRQLNATGYQPKPETVRPRGGACGLQQR